MLTRLYANAFRSFVDFEYRPGPCDLLTGRPGTGRTSIRRLLDNLQEFLLPWRENAALCDAFWRESYTCWLPDSLQTVELEIDHEAHHFVYHVAVHYTDDEYRPVLTSEQLHCNGQLLFSFTQDPERPHMDVTYHEDDHDDDGDAPPPSLQALAGNRHYLREELIEPTDTRLHIFRDWWLSAVWNLDAGNDDVRHLEGDASWPGVGFGRFTPWIRTMLRTAQDRVIAMDGELAEVLDGYLRLQLPTQPHKHLDVLFHNPTGGAPIAVNFDEIAAEQRVLIQLYALVHLGLEPGRVLILDAPHAALSRGDMHRWLASLLRASQDIRIGSMQLMVMVNDPEIVDDLPGGRVCRFVRENGGATVVVTKEA